MVDVTRADLLWLARKLRDDYTVNELRQPRPPHHYRDVKQQCERLERFLRDAANAMRDWRPIETAPRDGTHIIARRRPEDAGQGGQRTWWGKASHVPLYGWCFGNDPEDIDIWQPDEWRPAPTLKAAEEEAAKLPMEGV